MFERLWNNSIPSATLFALTLGFASSGSFAAEKTAPAREDKHPERIVAWMQKELALSPTQTAQVREILRPEDSLVQPPGHFERRLGSEDRGPGPRDGMFPFGDEFLDQLKSNRVDTAALHQGFNERRARMQAWHDKIVFKFVQLHGVLTPAQRLKLADIVETRRAKHRDRADKKPRRK
jgi:Spy/CpxP family protein refolding chaperone